MTTKRDSLRRKSDTLCFETNKRIVRIIRALDRRGLLLLHKDYQRVFDCVVLGSGGDWLHYRSLLREKGRPIWRLGCVPGLKKGDYTLGLQQSKKVA